MAAGIVLLLLLGFIIGISGIGGFLFPPLIISILPVGVREAMVISLGSFIFLTTSTSAAYCKQKMVNFKHSGLLVAGALPGVILGLTVNLAIPDRHLKMALALFLLGAGLLLLFKQPGREPAGNGPALNGGRIAALAGVGLAAGLMSGFIGVGGPIVTIPLLINLGYNPRFSIGTSVFAAIFIVAFAFSAHVLYTPVELRHVLFVSVPATAAALLGARFSGRLNQRAGRLIVSAVTLLSSFYLILF